MRHHRSIVSLLQTGRERRRGRPNASLGVRRAGTLPTPPQAQHIANLLDELTAKPEGSSQVLVSTHSPYFVSSKGFESVRLLHKRPAEPCSNCQFRDLRMRRKAIGRSMGETPHAPTVLMAKIEQIMQPSQRGAILCPGHCSCRGYRGRCVHLNTSPAKRQVGSLSSTWMPLRGDKRQEPNE